MQSGVTLRTAHPLAKRLGRTADLRRHRDDGRPSRFVPSLGVQDQSHYPFPELRGVSFVAPVSQVGGLRQTRYGSDSTQSGPAGAIGANETNRGSATRWIGQPRDGEALERNTDRSKTGDATRHLRHDRTRADTRTAGRGRFRKVQERALRSMECRLLHACFDREGPRRRAGKGRNRTGNERTARTDGRDGIPQHPTGGPSGDSSPPPRARRRAGHQT